ncbi:major facilitator superfamily domain-containing protein [Chaetomium sp. MPI-SDFR-AT-0129]|nr:major facilitator superfamily domain-containing protein [Chaetomium sp. MPI-SDFR-AT-0129]
MMSASERDADSSQGVGGRRTAATNGTADSGDYETSETTGLLGRNADGNARRASTQDAAWAGSEDFAGLPWWKRPSVAFLVGPYAIFTLAFGGSLVPKLNLVIDLVCKHYFADRSATDPDFPFTPVIPGGNNRQCFIPEVQKQVATFQLALTVTIGILSSLTAPKLGSLSDRYGRKRMIIICSLGGILSELVTIVAAKFPETVPYQWLLLGSVFEGLAGSFTAGSVLSNAYTSDCTPPSKRGVAIGYLHSCLFGGLAFGPLIAGYLVEWTGSLISIFYILLGCHITFVLFMAFIIPESLSRKRQLLAREKHRRKKEALGLTSPYAGIPRSQIPFTYKAHRFIRSFWTSNPLAPLEILFPTGPGTARLQRNFLFLAFIDVVILGAAISASPVIVIYVEYMFEWGNLESSRFVSMASMVRVLVLISILPLTNYFFRKRPAAKRLREQQRLNPTADPASLAQPEKNRGADEVDIWILRAALLSDVVGVTGYIFARSGPVFVLSAFVTSIGGLGSATIQAAITKHVPPQRVGQMLGAIGLLHALARIAAPIVFNQLYAATVESFPQAFFVLLAGLFALAFGASFFVIPHVYMKGEDETAEEEENGRTTSREGTQSVQARRDALEDDELLTNV